MTTKLNDMIAAAALLDLARNVGGLDDAWLANAHEKTLRDLVTEWRAAARQALDKAGVE